MNEMVAGGVLWFLAVRELGVAISRTSPPPGSDSAEHGYAAGGEHRPRKSLGLREAVS